MKRIKSAVGLGFFIVFFLFLFLSVITLNITYETLAIALLFGTFLLARFNLEKTKKDKPLPPRERALYFIEIFGVALMLLAIVAVGYENSYIQFFIKTEVWYIWLSGVFIVGIGECAHRVYSGRFHFKSDTYQEVFVEAKSVTLAPIDTQLNVDKRFSEFVKKRLIKQNLTLSIGQKISLKVFPLPFPLTDSIPFEILETDPEGNVKVTKETTVKILSQPTASS